METHFENHKDKPITAEDFKVFLEWVAHLEAENRRLEAEVAELKRKRKPENGRKQKKSATAE